MQPQTSYVPTSLTPEQVGAIRQSNKLKMTWALICLIGPTALLIISVALYAITSLVSGVIGPELHGYNNSIGHVIINIILFIVGVISVMTWFPGIIVGIILLVTRKPLPPLAQ